MRKLKTIIKNLMIKRKELSIFEARQALRKKQIADTYFKKDNTYFGHGKNLIFESNKELDRVSSKLGFRNRHKCITYLKSQNII